MQHFAEVLKILDAAVRHDPQQAVSYAELLSDKLANSGDTRQAKALRSALEKGAARATSASSTGISAPPLDKESRLETVDVYAPSRERSGPVYFGSSIQAEIDAFVSSVTERDQLYAHGLEVPGRLLLHGAPGTGKTSVARRVAIQLNLPLVVARSDALVSSLLGQTSRNIREVFEYASRFPCVLLLDEFDALAKNRADAREVGELQRVVIAMLENLDTFSDDNVLIAATNHPELLDVAVWRRFAQSIRLPLPQLEVRKLIWRDALSMLVVTDADTQRLAELSEEMSGAEIRRAANDIARTEILDKSPELRVSKALQRLARYVDRGVDVLQDTGSEIRALRDWAPDIFTLRNLAELFQTSTRQVSKHLKEDDVDVEPSASLALLAQ